MWEDMGMRVWAVVTVFAIALSGCADIGSAGSEVGTEPAPLGNTARFCQVWPDARVKLMSVVTGEETFVYQDNEIRMSQFLSDVDSLVPIEVRDAWDRAYAIYVMTADLGFVTGYSEGFVRAQHLEMAFGDGGRDAAIAETEASLAVIDEWEVTACGDFCSRWPDIERVLGFQEDSIWHDLSQHIDADEALIAVGDRLVPEAVSTPWTTLTQLQAGFFALARHVDFSQENIPPGEEWTQLVTEYLGTWFEDDQGMGAREISDRARDTIWNWVDSNCEATTAATDPSSGPGFLSLWYQPDDYLNNRLVMAALLPLGADFSTNRSPANLVAATCLEGSEVLNQWDRMFHEATMAVEGSEMDPEDFMQQAFQEEIARPLFSLRDAEEADYEKQSICDFVGWIGEDEPALIPGGRYELFVGTYVGGPGASSIYSAAPEYCVELQVTVSGDTLIELPALEPCTLGPTGRTEEIARRTPAPFAPGGTLQLEIGSVAGPEGYDRCPMNAVLLPTGTTLNDVGRGDIWPSGMFTLSRPSPRHLQEDDMQGWLEIPGLVPILETPGAGGSPMGMQPDFIEDGQWDTRFPEPIPLAAGTYDLRIEEWCENEGMRDESEIYRQCAFTTVTVSGVTVIKMPELGTCP